jgi:hypothetical protein
VGAWHPIPVYLVVCHAAAVRYYVHVQQKERQAHGYPLVQRLGGQTLKQVLQNAGRGRVLLHTARVRSAWEGGVCGKGKGQGTRKHKFEHAPFPLGAQA